MPKDEFERLERRWREQPLFLETPRRRPFKLLAGMVLFLGIFVGLAAMGLPQANLLFNRLVGSDPEPAVEQTARADAAGLRLPHSVED